MALISLPPCITHYTERLEIVPYNAAALDCARVSPPSARFTYKRSESYVINYTLGLPASQQMLIFMTFNTFTFNFLRHLLVEDYFTYASYRKIRCSSLYSTIITLNNLSPRNNTILLLTRAQPSFPYDRNNSTDSTALAYTLIWRATTQLSLSPRPPPCTMQYISR